MSETQYWTIKETAVAWQVTAVTVINYYIASGRVPEAKKFDSHWRIPAGTPKPEPLPRRKRKEKVVIKQECDDMPSPSKVSPEFLRLDGRLSSNPSPAWSWSSATRPSWRRQPVDIY